MSDKYPEINEVITYIHQHLDEPLPLDRLARYAAYSPYHFARIFKDEVGLPPHYYISSIRLQKAKELLLQTNFSIREIGMEVGQQSLGTFTTRFKEKVGVSPAQFRHSIEQVPFHIHSLQQLTNWERDHLPIHVTNGVHGLIDTPLSFQGIILVGLFLKPIPEGLPRYGTLLSSSGAFTFYNVHPGTYYVMATAVSWEMAATDILLPHSTLRAMSAQPVIVKPGNLSTPAQQLTLREPQLDDPPILISLPLLMQTFLNRVELSHQK